MKTYEEMEGRFAVRKHWDPFGGRAAEINLSFMEAMVKIQEHFEQNPDGSVLISIERQGS